MTYLSFPRLYLAGSIKVWREQFLARYASEIPPHVSLFEPGTLRVSPDHTSISEATVRRCMDEIERSDALLAYMKPYVPDLHGGPAGTDSAWECGYGHGLGKKVVALIDDEAHLAYFEEQWMLTFNFDAFATPDEAVMRRLSEGRFAKVPVLYGAHGLGEALRAYLAPAVSAPLLKSSA